MILPIYLYGQQVLRDKASLIDKNYPDIKKLISNMFDTMYNADGIGLAAPQVGVSICLVVIDADTISDIHPICAGFKRTMINPEIIEESEETVALDEGCLSLPKIHEKVIRPENITVKYLNENFEEVEEELEGFAARVVQHELSHLDGDLFIDHISPIRKQLNKSKLNNIIKGAVSCSYRTKAYKK